MPLVSGVCRKASAPKLSHGGSRLNASKPEASPKTRCPTQTKTNQTRVLCARASFLSSLFFYFSFWEKNQKEKEGRENRGKKRWRKDREKVRPSRLILRTAFCKQKTKKTFYRIAIQRTAGLACLEGAKYLHDHKTFLHRLQNLHRFFCGFFILFFPRRRRGGAEKINPEERSVCVRYTKRAWYRTLPAPKHLFLFGGAIPTLNQQQNTQHYVPLQTREHAWAGMSGTLRFGGARGAFYVPRR